MTTALILLRFFTKIKKTRKRKQSATDGMVYCPACLSHVSKVARSNPRAEGSMIYIHGTRVRGEPGVTLIHNINITVIILVNIWFSPSLYLKILMQYIFK